eukprot:403330948
MASINSGSLLFSKSESIDIEICNNIFNGRGQLIEYQDITNIVNNNLNPLSLIGFQGRLITTVFSNASVKQSNNNTYQYNYNDGSIYYLQNSSMNESDSNLQEQQRTRRYRGLLNKEAPQLVTSSKQTLINYKIWKIQVSLITCQLGSIMYSLNLRGRYPEDTLKIS